MHFFNENDREACIVKAVGENLIEPPNSGTVPESGSDEDDSDEFDIVSDHDSDDEAEEAKSDFFGELDAKRRRIG